MIAALIAQKKGELGSFGAPSAAFGPAIDEGGGAAISTLERLISVALGGVTLIAALYLLFVFVVAAFDWMGAGGDAGKVTKARDSMVNALIGMLLIVGAYAIMGVVGSVFGINILNPGEMIQNITPQGPVSSTPTPNPNLRIPQ